ncbi:MAG: A/G-specific adenine glycosylase, partial [Planctomycetota bacterium]
MSRDQPRRGRLLRPVRREAPEAVKVPSAPSSASARDTLPSALRARIRRALLRWYDRHARDLPWRRRRHDPYAQWVAEIMLQQTRVETVIRYYERFLRRFPDVNRLAAARHDTLLKYWEGLGYYRRALHMHEAARRIVKEGNGLPASAEAWRRLPGIGEYTAAAVASIAFGEPVAAVDGNVARVLARLFGVTDAVAPSEGRRRIRGIADRLVSPSRPGDFNQAWMDLGSMVCTPRGPRCDVCPLASCCRSAHRVETVGRLPRRGRHRPLPE